jgi:guanosine-3',5'-bis(diphosphate) 3'-pyrophosphohydrolase
MLPPFSLLLDALAFAAEQHRHQRRKGPGIGPQALRTPYINHPIRVAELIAKAGITDVDVLCAAILHDTIEDTEATEADLRARFGDAITGMVLEVTDDKTLVKAERKRLQVVHAAHISPGAGVVKLADKVDNVRDILIAAPHGWDIERRREYFDWALKVVSAIPDPNTVLRATFDAQYAQRP